MAGEHGPTEFVGYAHETAEGIVTAIVRDGACADSAEAGETVSFAANQTPFYGESGGQAGDTGTATGDGVRLTITDTKKRAGLHVHEARVEEGALRVGDTLTLSVDGARRARIKANHSTTHLLHAALRRRLGTHVTQKGSFVGPDGFRFDFSNDGAVSADDLAGIEAEVNQVIRQNAEGHVRYMPYDEAIESGAMALFGEKYDDEVRVLRLGDDPDDPAKPYSVELCGGTHVDRTGDAQLFAIVNEGAVASGIRRIEAVTGADAIAHLKGQADAALAAAAALKTTPDELAGKVRALTEERKRLEKALLAAKKKAALPGGTSAPAGERVGPATFTGAVLDGVPPKELRGLIAAATKKDADAVAVYVATNDGKASVSVGVGPDLTAAHPAPDLVKLAVEALGGRGGGGKPDLAHGGGPDAAAAQAAVDAVRARLAG